MKLLIVVEQTASGFSAYAPDIPGCIATGSTREVVEQTMREAIGRSGCITMLAAVGRFRKRAARATCWSARCRSWR